MSRRLALVLEYDGSCFAGFQRQGKSDLLTVQGVLEAAIVQVLQEPARVAAAGRTDRGVHALGQVVHFDTSNPMPVETVHRALNSCLQAGVAVRRVLAAPPGFHARFSARRRHYQYLILNRRERSALLGPWTHQVHAPLDIHAMSAAAALLLGCHDFFAFSSGEPPGRSRQRTLHQLTVVPWRGTGDGEEAARPWIHCPFSVEPGELVVVDVVADAFLRGMVRMIVGTLLQVGLGNLSPQEMPSFLEAKNSRLGGPAASACGLCLMGVDYGVQI